jgi:hypothetical protein
MRIKLSIISLTAFVFPALLALIVAPSFGYTFSDKGHLTIVISVIASALGYVASHLPKRRMIRPRIFRQNRTDTYFSLTLISIGVCAIFANFAINGAIPLLSSGDSRVALQATILWNLFILGNLGVFLYSRSTIGHPQSLKGRSLIAVFIFHRY